MPDNREIESSTPLLLPDRFKAGSESFKVADFLPFLRQNISIVQLLDHRRDQAEIEKIISYHFTRDEQAVNKARYRSITLALNPYPVMEAQTPDRIYYYGETFQLNDSLYLYAFPEWNPTEDVPSYLRPQDVVPSGHRVKTYPPDRRHQALKELNITEYQFDLLIGNDSKRIEKYAKYLDIPFKKPLLRASAAGGVVQRYNYNIQQWENGGDGDYKPPITNQIRHAAKNNLF